MAYSGFPSSKTWDALIQRQPERDWFELMWFKGSVPKHSFNMWVCHLNRLPTRHRMASWGLNISSDCCLCLLHSESRDHLFISCTYAAEIWSLVFSRLTPSHQRLCSWAEVLSWMKTSSARAPSLLRKVVAQVSVFHIWKQMNSILHNAQAIPPKTIFKIIDLDIINTINSRRHKKSWSDLMLLWIE